HLGASGGRQVASILVFIASRPLFAAALRASSCSRSALTFAVSIFETDNRPQNPIPTAAVGQRAPERGSERFRRPVSPRQGPTRGDVLEKGSRSARRAVRED